MKMSVDLTNQFLIAMPALQDPNFAKSVSYICEHNEHGTVGIIINRPMPVSLYEVLQQLQITCTDEHAKTQPVFFGGPLQAERGFVIHTPHKKYRTTVEVCPEIHLTTSQDILEDIAIGQGPSHFIVALGYAGWDGEQITHEIAANSWLNCPANSTILFETPYHKQWHAAAGLLGIDINALTSDAGHG